MWVELAAAAYLLADTIYHRLTDDKMGGKRPETWRPIKSDDGAAYPMVWGRYRVRKPVPAWLGKHLAIEAEPGGVWANVTPTFIYTQSSHWIIAIGFAEGTQQFCGMWAGERRFEVAKFSDVEPESLVGDGGFEPDTRRCILSTQYVPGLTGNGSYDSSFDTHFDFERADVNDEFQIADIEFFNGSTSQELLEDNGTPLTYLGTHMTTSTSLYSRPEQELYGAEDPDTVPDYRGYLSAFLFLRDVGVDALSRHAILGCSPSQPALSFEVASNRDTGSTVPATGIYARIGPDANPANVLYDVLTDPRKGAIDPSYLDLDSFSAAAVTLYQESHGFSFCAEAGELDVGGMIQMLLKQVDGALSVDETDQKIRFRLIRSDYDVRDLPHITGDNCDQPVSFTLGTRTNAVNKVTIVYADREHDYNDRSVSVSDLAAITASGRVREEVIEMRGITNAALAQRVAARELAWRGAPSMKCEVHLKREFKDLEIGEPVKVTWTEPDIAGVVFRVASKNLGTLEDGVVVCDLVQDQFYVYRQLPPQPPGLGHPDIGNIQIKVMP